MSVAPELPKVELHLHLDLAASYGAIAALAPGTTLAEYRARYVGPRRCQGLAGLLGRTAGFLDLQQDERGLRVVVEDAFDQLLRSGVIYAELRFAPLQHTRRGLAPERVVEIVEGAASEAIAATGVEARILLCTLRHYDAEASLRTARLVDAFRGGLVAGLDLAGDEAGHPLDPHEPAFRWAAERGIPLTAHAGEACGAASVDETLRRLGPARIGHGVRAIESDATVAELVRRGIHLEVCPTSNVQTGIAADHASHPVDALRRRGVSLSISTDCPGLCDVSLAQEYDRLRTAFAWTAAEFDAANRAALAAAFVPEDVRARLLGVLDAGGAAAAPAATTGSGAIQTVTGRWVDVTDPDLAQIHIADIARALANQCRFGGHSREFYSVAQHSAIVCDLLLAEGGSPAEALTGLLHDAAEAYLVDLPHPIKHRTELGPPYRRAEARIEQAIRDRFDLVPTPAGLKPLDRRLLATERARFTATDGDWPELAGFAPLELEIEPWPPPVAAREFLARYERLVAGRAGAGA